MNIFRNIVDCMQVRSVSGQRIGKLVMSAAFAVVAPVAFAQELVIASGGGTLQDAQRKAFFEPFEKETGIRVVDTTGMSLAKIRSMVETGNIEWDLFFASPTPFFQSAKAGYLEPIDFSKIDKETISQMDPRMVNEFGVGSMFYAQVIAYNTNTFGAENHPKSWADFWDTEKFPGVRVLPAGTYDQPPTEPALLAAGIDADKLYPVDLDLAYEKLTEIRGSVAQWVTSGAAAPQALASGEADMAMANSGRISQLRTEGAPVDYVWNEALVSSAYWAIPKGAKNVDAALKFIEFVSRPEQQLAMAALLPYAPVNRVAAEMLPDDVARNSPMTEYTRDEVILMNPESWSTESGDGSTYLERNAVLWEAWSRNQ